MLRWSVKIQITGNVLNEIIPGPADTVSDPSGKDFDQYLTDGRI